jgi:hypothetical protein
VHQARRPRRIGHGLQAGTGLDVRWITMVRCQEYPHAENCLHFFGRPTWCASHICFIRVTSPSRAKWIVQTESSCRSPLLRHESSEQASKRAVDANKQSIALVETKTVDHHIAWTSCESCSLLVGQPIETVGAAFPKLPLRQSLQVAVLLRLMACCATTEPPCRDCYRALWQLG